MRRSRSPARSSPYRALAHHQAQQQAVPGGSHGSDSVLSLLRSFNVETNPTTPIHPSPLTASTIRDMSLDLVERIRCFPLFMSAPEEFLAAIGRHLKPQIHAAHDVILNEGDDAKAMYWLVRGVVAVTSRDGEAVYAELKPGSFFGEIGVLMKIPRTATIIARTKCLLVVLMREDLQAELPRFPEMEKAIRQEAQERLNILQKKRQESRQTGPFFGEDGSKASRQTRLGEFSRAEVGFIQLGLVINTKKRKSPSPGVAEDPAVSGSALGSGIVNVRETLRELPLFSTLPPDILHFLGLSAQPKTYPPFIDIVRQGTRGHEIFFIVRGDAEVIREATNGRASSDDTVSHIRPRLKQGQYFGEVASLGLSEVRTATVRSVTAVECLMIGGEALQELWRRCPTEIKDQVVDTARKRYGGAGKKKAEDDVEMSDVLDRALFADEQASATPSQNMAGPEVTITTSSNPASPSDLDPYMSVDMEIMRNRRRNSLAPPTLQSPAADVHVFTANGIKLHAMEGNHHKFVSPPSPATHPHGNSSLPAKRLRVAFQQSQAPDDMDKTTMPDDVLASILRHLDILNLIRLQRVSKRWRRLLRDSPRLCTVVKLSDLNRKVTDSLMANVLAPFIGQRPVEVDISNCFHLSDEGFSALWRSCGKNVKTWRMQSVWVVSASQILEMSENAKGLEEVDWSNCRKVNDGLLVRVVGWVVQVPLPHAKMAMPASQAKARKKIEQAAQRQEDKGENEEARGNGEGRSPHRKSVPVAAVPIHPPPGSVIGCPKLSRLDLSYCKHITDRSMHHLALHASNRLQSLKLTRCTTITDHGFLTWTNHHFTQLTHLGLADCTYLTDNSIVALVNAAKHLTHLDLSFCCALSDTATEVVALGLPNLQDLRLAFCGSAVSDASLGCVSLHLYELRRLSVRGCVRVTGQGVEDVLRGCSRLEWFDLSQCKNLVNWLVLGGVERWGVDERSGEKRAQEKGRPEKKAATDSVVETWTFDAAAATALSLAPTTPVPGSGPLGRPLHPEPHPYQLQEQQQQARGGMMGPGGVGAGIMRVMAREAAVANTKTMHFGPGLRPVIPPKGMGKPKIRKPVHFVVEKGVGGLR